MRVVDYKTGHRKPSGIQSVEDLFNPEKIDNHSDYCLQTILYGTILVANKMNVTDDTDGVTAPVGAALYYIQHSMKDNYNPIISFNKDKITDVSVYHDEFMSRLKDFFRELFQKEKAFEPTPFRQRCKNCPYRALCH